MRRFLKDPLVHFMILGAVVFALYAYRHRAAPVGNDGKTIIVDENTLLDFMQSRARAFDEPAFRRRLHEMSLEQRDDLIDDFVREEVLYREARSLGLDQDDYIIRRRLVQKLEFITESLSRKTVSLTDDDVAAYFQAHRDDYAVQPHVTFTHVFFDAEKQGPQAAVDAARDMLEQLNRDHVPFDQAVRYGDRFPFHLNYVERTPDFVESHFGPGMASRIFSMDVDPARWQGPLTSPYGAHLVLITQRTEGRPATLEEIEGQVRQDAEMDRKNEIMKQSIDDIVARYEVRVEFQSGG